MPQASAVKVKKVVRKKYVLNPYSSIIFSVPPPIDQVPLQLVEETANQYTVGQGAGELGDGDGDAGFGMGKATGRIRLIRLQHPDPAWNRNMGIGGDYNLIAEFVARFPKYKGKTGESYGIEDDLGSGRFPGEAKSAVGLCGRDAFFRAYRSGQEGTQKVPDRTSWNDPRG